MPSSHPSRDDRRLLLAGIGAGVLGLIGLAVLAHAIGSGLNPLSAIGRPVLFAALGALALTGRHWASAILVLWAALLAFFNAFAALTLFRTGHARDGALFLGLALLFLAASLLVHRSRTFANDAPAAAVDEPRRANE